MLAIGGIWGTVPPAAVPIFPFDRAPFWPIICFFGAIDVREEVFEEGLSWMGGKSRVQTQALK